MTGPERERQADRRFDAIGLGIGFADYLGIVPGYPEPGAKCRMRTFSRQGGGLVPTALVALARLGAAVSYLGKLGTDALSNFVLDELNKDGVDTSHVCIDDNVSSGFAFVIVDEATGERTVVWTNEKVRQPRPEELSREFATSARFLLVEGYAIGPALTLAQWARESGTTRVVLDAENTDEPRMDEIISVTDVLIVPESFGLEFSGKTSPESASEALLDMGPSIVVLTQGDKGCLCRTAEQCFHRGAFKVDVADTTGCGDVYHGAFTYGLLQDWELTVVAEFANAAGALNCRALGGRTAAPTFAETREFLLEHGSEEMRSALTD